MKRIHLISSPRNISTALMYAFGNRKDTSVVDEPFYANYLSRVDIVHPGQEEILNALPHTVEEILDKFIFSEYPTEILFIKNMAHHLEGIDRSFASRLKNVFLIRSPEQLIASFAKVIPKPTMRDIGVKAQWDIFNDFEGAVSYPIVVDSNELLKNPTKVLRIICDRLDIPFDLTMISWDSGPRPEDGVWAKYWYENVHRSSGWEKQRKKDRILPVHLMPLCEEANVYYHKMYEHSIKA